MKFCRVKVITSQYIDVVVDDDTSASDIKDKAQEQARYEGECYDVEIVLERDATEEEEADLA